MESDPVMEEGYRGRYGCRTVNAWAAMVLILTKTIGPIIIQAKPPMANHSAERGDWECAIVGSLRRFEIPSKLIAAVTIPVPHDGHRVVARFGNPDLLVISGNPAVAIAVDNPNIAPNHTEI